MEPVTSVLSLFKIFDSVVNLWKRIFGKTKIHVWCELGGLTSSQTPGRQDFIDLEWEAKMFLANISESPIIDIKVVPITTDLKIKKGDLKVLQKGAQTQLIVCHKASFHRTEVAKYSNRRDLTPETFSRFVLLVEYKTSAGRKHFAKYYRETGKVEYFHHCPKL